MSLGFFCPYPVKGAPEKLFEVSAYHVPNSPVVRWQTHNSILKEYGSM